MNQTTIEFMHQELWQAPKDKWMWQMILDQAKKMEKEQMLNFYMWIRMNENSEKYLDFTDDEMYDEYLKQKH